MGFAAVFTYQVDPGGVVGVRVRLRAGRRVGAVLPGRRGPRTELLRSEARYLVIDRWRSAAAYDAFVGTHSDEYRRRNDAAAALYRHEEFLGRFQSAA